MEPGFAMLIPDGPLRWPDGSPVLMIYHKDAWIEHLLQTGRIGEIEKMTGPEREKEYLKWCAETGRKNESPARWTTEGGTKVWSSGI